MYVYCTIYIYFNRAHCPEPKHIFVFRLAIQLIHIYNTIIITCIFLLVASVCMYNYYTMYHTNGALHALELASLHCRQSAIANKWKWKKKKKFQTWIFHPWKTIVFGCRALNLFIFITIFNAKAARDKTTIFECSLINDVLLGSNGPLKPRRKFLYKKQNAKCD